MAQEALKQIGIHVKNQETEEIDLSELQLHKISEELKHALEKIEDLISLSMNECQLSTLENFPVAKNLIRLELQNNKFTGKDLKHLKNLTNIQSLSLGNNKIENYEDLEQFKTFEQLIQLDLSETPLSLKPDYRQKVFEAIPSLEILDNLDVEGIEFEYDSGSEGDEEEAEDEGSDDEDELEEDDGEDEDEDDYDDEDEEEEEPVPVTMAKRIKK